MSASTATYEFRSAKVIQDEGRTRLIDGIRIAAIRGGWLHILEPASRGDLPRKGR